MEKDKSYRFRLPSELFDAAMAKAAREDLTLAQVCLLYTSPSPRAS